MTVKSSPTVTVIIVYYNGWQHIRDNCLNYYFRNFELEWIKNNPQGIMLCCLPSLMIGASLAFLCFAVKHGNPGLYQKAKMDMFRLLPEMLNE